MNTRCPAAARASLGLPRAQPSGFIHLAMALSHEPTRNCLTRLLPGMLALWSGWANSVCAASPPPPAGSIAVGVYFNEQRVYAPADEQAFQDLQAQTGRLAELYMNFQTWTEEWKNFSTRLANNALAHGGIFMVVWCPMKTETGQDPAWSCRAVSSGKYDAYIRQYATEVHRWNQPLMIRLAHEMNGSWYPWGVAFTDGAKRTNGNTPADYVGMWRHVHDLFQAEGATNVLWVWSPNLLFVNAHNSKPQAVADYRALYPGDAYVDWIGLDGYNDGLKSQWKSFAELFGDSYQAITALTSKPLMIAEFGCTEQGAPAGSSKAAWITQTYLQEIPEHFPRIRLVNWFCRDKSQQGEADWRFNSSPAALAAYRAVVNSPLYQGRVLRSAPN
jgi:mannan endo-1,4-beta-mannosidase